MEDKELLIRQTVLIEEIVKKVTIIEGRLNQLNDEEVRELATQQAVISEKVARLETIIYGALSIIFIQIVALIFLWIQAAKKI